MAGQGARFGHRFKPFLTVGEDTFIEAAVRPFRRFSDRIARFVFVYLEEQERDHEVRDRLGAMFGDLPFETVLLDRPTRGPAETISRAVSALRAGGPAFICDCDHSLDVAPLFDAVAGGWPFEAILPVWPLEPEKLASWSVAMVEDDRVLAVAEKQMPAETRGTATGVIGCYGFRDLADVSMRAASAAATNFSDVIAGMVSRGSVRAARIPHAVFFGDPERLATAQARGLK